MHQTIQPFAPLWKEQFDNGGVFEDKKNTEHSALQMTIIVRKAGN